MAKSTVDVSVHIGEEKPKLFTAGAHSIGAGGWANVEVGGAFICFHANAPDDLYRLAEQISMGADAVVAEHRRRLDIQQARDNVANGTATPQEKALAAS